MWRENKCRDFLKCWELEKLRLLEPDYSSLVNNGEPGVLICEAEPVENGARLLIDEEESPLLFAVKSGDEWCGTSWLFRPPTGGELALFEAATGISIRKTARMRRMHTGHIMRRSSVQRSRRPEMISPPTGLARSAIFFTRCGGVRSRDRAGRLCRVGNRFSPFE